MPRRRLTQTAFTVALLSLCCPRTGGAGAPVRVEETQPVARASATTAATAATATAVDDRCSALAAQLAAQHQQTRHELRLIKRDLAVLNQNLEKPGVAELMAGIGYILGLFGIAAFVAAHRQNRRAQGD